MSTEKDQTSTFEDGQSSHLSTVIVFVVSAILLVSFIVVLPGFRGRSRIFLTIRFSVSLFIGTTILMSVYGHDWEVGTINTNITFRPYKPGKIQADVSLKIGVRGVTIALTGTPLEQMNEIVMFNEDVYWEWTEGKAGGRPQVNMFERHLRDAKERLLPLPILWTMEWFTVITGNVSYEKVYSTAGWTGFVLWVLTNIVSNMVVRLAGYCTILTGGAVLLAILTWASIRQVPSLSVRLENDFLTTSFGLCFGLIVFVGVLCLVAGILLVYLDLTSPDLLASLFGVNVLNDYDECYIGSRDSHSERPLEENDATKEGSSSPNHPAVSKELYGLRKRGLLSSFKRSSEERPLPAPRCISDRTSLDRPVYENVTISYKRLEQVYSSSHENILMYEL
ncbi:dual oxidase maturation factor 1-like isoform X2 [Tachypleus tridentatus]|uniref:dual oxidase maturation factor 1-like isoform X2 n=2 Tax=Tachypleus tridentatus TaxID=6853 RepID=UPI003FD5E430